ncbi:MAG: Holliday junction resolvase RuvX [Candidatus Gracilibacteria bacterium]|nr:Holliday junction resolvase RuvX [Candidatus Gracilibacteria bacterium]
MYLGLDLGNKRCGLAVYIEGVVIPKEIVNRVEIIDKIKEYIKKYDIKIIVVGLPYDLYNLDTKQLDKTKKFIEKLKIIFPNQKIDSIDERFTSFQSENILREMNIFDTNGKKDAISASLILESYLKI